MLFVLLIHATVLLIITAQKNLTPFGQASQISTLVAGKTDAKNAIQPPISNTWATNGIIHCTHTTGYQATNPKPAWWMFAFSIESAFITEIQIYYREGLAIRMDGFKLYVTNTSTIPPVGYLCYEDSDAGLPNIIQTIPCNQLGKYVIYYDDKGSREVSDKTRVYGPMVELCHVAINGCQKSSWGSNCENNCAEDCIERNCFPGNGSCVWGCNPTNCLTDVCDKDTAVCTIGCKERRTGTYCNQYNMASDSLVWQFPSGSEEAGLAKDGNKNTCSKTVGSTVQFQVDIMEESIVTGVIITFVVGTTSGGHHTVYASNTSDNWTSGTVLYNSTHLPVDVSFSAVFRYLTYVPPVQGGSSELEICEIGILGCPSTKYGQLCNISCPANCHGPCDLDIGSCSYGCKAGWSANLCDKECTAGTFGKDCKNQCSKKLFESKM